MSTESTVDYTAALPEGSRAAGVGVGSVGRGGFAAPLEEYHAVFCGSVSTWNLLYFSFFFPPFLPAQRVIAY